jgi:hypothetical protein
MFFKTIIESIEKRIFSGFAQNILPDSLVRVVLTQAVLRSVFVRQCDLDMINSAVIASNCDIKNFKISNKIATQRSLLTK